MHVTTKSIGFEKFFRQQTMKWSVIGFILTALLAFGCLLYTAKSASEAHVASLARSTALGFRHFILDGHIREAQEQIKESLGLKSNEVAVVLDSQLKPIYAPVGQSYQSKCSPEKKFCWDRKLSFIEYLEPVYFDAERTELLGYVDLKLAPVIDFQIIFAILAVIAMSFLIQTFGLLSALSATASRVASQISLWNGFLKQDVGSTGTQINVQDQGFARMEQTAQAFELEIEKIKTKAAADAKVAAQLNILKEVSHDLKTPLSQLRKYVSVFINQARKNGPVNDELAYDIERSIDRLANISKQTGSLLHDIKDQGASCDLSEETLRFIRDLGKDEEVVNKGLVIKTDFSPSIPNAKITPTGFYRILDNLVRNAIHAVGASGVITIKLINENSRPVLSVIDNGCGISADIREKVFEFDFSTKPGRGTGMGLGIVKNLCSTFNAQLELHSELNKGTEFSLKFEPSLRSEAV